MIRLPRSAPSNQVFRGLETDGALIVEGFLEAEKLMTLKAVVTALADQHASGASGEARFWQAFHGSKTKRFTGIGLHTEIFFDLLEDELLQTLGDALLTTSGSQYWMNTCQAMIIGPGERAQMLHRDCDNWSSVTSLLWPNCPELTFSMILALDKVDEAVGATRVIPGSHLWLDHSRIGDPNDAEAAELAAGDACLQVFVLVHKIHDVCAVLILVASPFCTKLLKNWLAPCVVVKECLAFNHKSRDLVHFSRSHQYPP